MELHQRLCVIQAESCTHSQRSKRVVPYNERYGIPSATRRAAGSFEIMITVRAMYV